jgi:hypothetical protein
MKTNGAFGGLADMYLSCVFDILRFGWKINIISLSWRVFGGSNTLPSDKGKISLHYNQIPPSLRSYPDLYSQNQRLKRLFQVCRDGMEVMK